MVYITWTIFDMLTYMMQVFGLVHFWIFDMHLLHSSFRMFPAVTLIKSNQPVSECTRGFEIFKATIVIREPLGSSCKTNFIQTPIKHFPSCITNASQSSISSQVFKLLDILEHGELTLTIWKTRLSISSDIFQSPNQIFRYR